MQFIARAYDVETLRLWKSDRWLGKLIHKQHAIRLVNDSDRKVQSLIEIIIGNVKVKKIMKKGWGSQYLIFIIKQLDMSVLNVLYFFKCLKEKNFTIQ